MTWVEIGRTADIVSVIGFVLTLVGLALMFQQAHRSAKAANIASSAALEARDKIRLLDLMTEISIALNEVEALRVCLARGRWSELLDHLNLARKSIVSVLNLIGHDYERRRAILSSAKVQLTNLSVRVDSWMARGETGTPLAAGSAARRQAIELLDSVFDVLMELRSEFGGMGHGEQTAGRILESSQDAH